MKLILKHKVKIFVLLFALAGCRAEETELVILSLNDIHSHIDDLDKVAAYVSEQRKLHPNVLLLSAGDLFSGNPVVDYYADKGYPIIDLMNDLHFDASTLGNHEFDYGQEALAMRIAQAGFPFICANISVDSSPIPTLRPYVVFTKSGEKIGVVGLTQERPEAHTERIGKLHFSNPQSEFEKYAPLRKKSNLLLALTHVGVPQDSLLAERFGEIDVIVGGHTHTRLDSGMLVNGVLITQADRYVSCIGRTTVKFRSGRVVSKRCCLVNVAQLTQRDTLVSRKIRAYNSNPALMRTVATLADTIYGQVNVGNFFCDAVRSATGVDIVLQNVKGIRVSALHAGEVTMSNLYHADPFGNELVRFNLTEADLKQLIKDAYLHFDRIDLCVSGITYKIRPVGSDAEVSIALTGGKPLNPNKRYSVAMNSYMSTKPSEYTLPLGDKGEGLGVTTVEAAVNYLEKHRNIRYTSPVRGEILHID
ncbi:MAG: bifunctional metallophosphatase/5'-nucleotidase [Prevotellaceae bacterium]|nr:bifunctional metallophosphatase/5'-nucleotidase [Prevotellaceae bacterium]